MDIEDDTVTLSKNELTKLISQVNNSMGINKPYAMVKIATLQALDNIQWAEAMDKDLMAKLENESDVYAMKSRIYDHLSFINSIYLGDNPGLEK